MPSVPIAFAVLRTTGPSPADDRVTDAAAVRCDADGAAAPWRAPAGAGRGRKADGRLIAALQAHCAALPLVVEDAAAFAAFLSARQAPLPSVLLGLSDLARIVHPTAPDYSLPALADFLGLGAPDAEADAVARALLVKGVWEHLEQDLRRLPPAALDLICRLADASGAPLARVLRAAAAEDGRLALEPDGGPEQLLTDHSDLLRRAQKEPAREPTQEPLRTDAICRMFSREGLIGRGLADYEPRPEQADMVYAVCEALNEGAHLLVEAGTGTGKSLAYMVPAIAWACTNGDRVVISTNTRNLQEQLYRKDLPLLGRLFPDRVRSALLKGRTNYLCARRFAHLARSFDREIADPADCLALAPLVAWLAETETGDLAECNGFQLSPAAASLTSALVTGGEECAGRACRMRSRCFVQRARALAQLADILVVNHALLFAESGLETPVLPPYRCVVFDEAHNLEDVATDALSVVVEPYSVYRVTNFLYRSRRDGSGSGLLATAMYEVGRMRDRPGAVAPGAARELCTNAMAAVTEVTDAARQFFETIGEPFAEVPPSVERILLAECRPSLGSGSEAWQAGARLQETVRSLGGQLEELAKAFEGAEREAAAGGELATDLRAQTVRLQEVCAAIELVLAQEDEAFVYWLERTRRDRGDQCSLHAAPLRVAQYFRDAFLRDKRTVVFTSATLQVDGSFDYMIERLGAENTPAERLRCLALGSSFDYERQALVGVTAFLPDPGGQRNSQYDVELAAFLTELLECTQGRAMVLFTSYSLLSFVYDAVRGPLQRLGITVLAQGHSGSREAITGLFRTRPRCVLLGTRSFWEGVDISGEALSCLVLTKLPFHVFTDPLVRGRTDYLRALGRDPFRHYTLPEAVIDFRQGFGRLIRTRTDAGVVIVTDRRLTTKGYGRSFLRSLPTRHRVFDTPQDALEEVRRFFARVRDNGS